VERRGGGGRGEVAGRIEERIDGMEAQGASAVTPCGPAAGVGFTGTHGAEDDAVPVRSVAGVSLWRMRPQPRHSFFFSHPRKAAFSLGVVAGSNL